MKQLTVYCSEELAGEVSQVLHKHDVESFVSIPGIYGTKLKTKGSFERDQTWPASAFVLFLEESKVPGITRDLEDYANKCHVETCLRMVVAPVEQVY